MPARAIPRTLLILVAVALILGGSGAGAAFAAARPAAQDDADVLTELIDQAQAEPSEFGPDDGALEQQEGQATILASGVDLTDLLVHVAFTNPSDADADPWDYGIVFRYADEEEHLRLILDSTGSWYFKKAIEPTSASGSLGLNFNLGAGEVNEIDLVAIADVGYFAVNGEFVDVLDLSAVTDGGDVSVGTAFFQEDTVPGAVTEFSDFEVWSLAGGEEPVATPSTDDDPATPVTGDDAGEFARLIDEASANPSVFGPADAELLQEEGTSSFFPAELDLTDFYAHAEFTNPDDEPWDYGFIFRPAGDNQDYRLVVESTGRWFFFLETTPVAEGGPIAGLNTGGGESNEIDLVVVGDVAYFGVNGDYVATLDTSEITGSGDVWAVTAFFQENTVDGAVTAVSNFEVWEIAGEDEPAPPTRTTGLDADELTQLADEAQAGEPIFGPESGELLQEAGSATVEPTQVTVADFVLSATLVNPTDAETWDYGFIFRDDGEQHYRLVIDSAGGWFFSIGVDPDLDSGNLVNLDTSPGGENEIELIVAGDSGAFAVNGAVVATLDTSQLTAAGDVWIGTAFFASNTVDSAVTAYEDFTIWSLEAGDVEPATPEATAISGGDLDPDEVFAAARSLALEQESVATISADELVEEDGFLALIFTEVDLRDFYASVDVENPDGPWDYGFVFRARSQEESFRIFVRNDGHWYSAFGTAEADDNGEVPSLATATGDVNTLELLAIGNLAIFVVNGEVAGTVDLSQLDGGGDIGLASAFYQEDTVSGRAISFSQLEVWSLDDSVPVAETPEVDDEPTPEIDDEPTPEVETTPDTGDDLEAFEAARDAAREQDSLNDPLGDVLVEDEDAITSIRADVAVGDFYARARFQNPSDVDTLFDYGFIFRNQGDDVSLRVFVRSDGLWFHTVGTETATTGGEVPSLQVEPDAVNTLELVALGDLGYLVVNGELAGTFDISAIPDAGDVAVAVAFLADDTVAGRETPFRDFAVWSLDEGAPVAETPEIDDEPTPEVDTEPTVEAEPTEDAGGVQVAVRLEEQDDSGLSGFAVLTEAGDETAVDLTLAGASGEEVLVIHEGSCADLDPRPAQLLPELDESGQVAAEIDVPLSELAASAHAIAAHASPADFATIVACGDIPAA